MDVVWDKREWDAGLKRRMPVELDPDDPAIVLVKDLPKEDASTSLTSTWVAQVGAVTARAGLDSRGTEGKCKCKCKCKCT